MSEAPHHPQNQARGTFVEIEGVVQPAPAPRFSRTPANTPGPPALPGDHTIDVLAEIGVIGAELKELLDDGVVTQSGTTNERRA